MRARPARMDGRARAARTDGGMVSLKELSVSLTLFLAQLPLATAIEPAQSSSVATKPHLIFALIDGAHTNNVVPVAPWSPLTLMRCVADL